jgi:hypothetical protein
MVWRRGAAAAGTCPESTTRTGHKARSHASCPVETTTRISSIAQRRHSGHTGSEDHQLQWLKCHPRAAGRRKSDILWRHGSDDTSSMWRDSHQWPTTQDATRQRTDAQARTPTRTPHPVDVEERFWEALWPVEQYAGRAVAETAAAAPVPQQAHHGVEDAAPASAARASS